MSPAASQKLAERNAAASYATAAPPPARPVQWRRALGLVRELVADPSRTELAFELFDAVGGRGEETAFRRFAASRAGRALLGERPSLREALSDAASLAALPEGSLGRAYLAFARERGFTPSGLLEANERGLGHVNALLDRDRLYFYERANVMHDLWHVVTGYGTDEAGEVALLAFSHAQGLSGRGVKLLIGTGLLLGSKRAGSAFPRFVLQASRRGKRSAPLLQEPWENRLAQPLGEVRGALGVPPLDEAHPGGIVAAAIFGRRVRG